MWQHNPSTSFYRAALPSLSSLVVGTKYRKHQVVVTVTDNKANKIPGNRVSELLFSVATGDMAATSVKLFTYTNHCSMMGPLEARVVLAGHLNRIAEKSSGILATRETKQKIAEEKEKEEVPKKEKAKQIVLPECPVCLGDMGPGVRIYQCGGGHLVCQTCYPKIKDCPSRCGNRMQGRAIGLEQYIATLHS